MPRKSLTIEQILKILTDTPTSIAALTNGLQTAQLHTPPEHDEWSANDVLAHLRSCADVWGDCIGLIITKDRPTIQAINPTTWIKSTDYLEQKFQTSLHSFITQRTELLAVLDRLSLEDWSRAAVVTGAGEPLERTVLDYGARLARHERTHIKQIEKIVKSMPNTGMN
jgi:hypothetical protein